MTTTMRSTTDRLAALGSRRARLQRAERAAWAAATDASLIEDYWAHKERAQRIAGIVLAIMAREGRALALTPASVASRAARDHDDAL